ncbi:MAG: hypothetical protein ACTHK6_11945, partial [Solirubrobacterales bacterium]
YVTLAISPVLIALIAATFVPDRQPKSSRVRGATGAGVGGEAVAVARPTHYDTPGSPGLFALWWEAGVAPLAPAERRLLAREIFRYDQLTRQIYDVDDVPLPRTRVEGVEYYVRQGVEFEFDMEEVLAAVRTGRVPSTERRPTVVDIHLQAGFREHVDSHDVVVGYVGKLAGSRSEPALS